MSSIFPYSALRCTACGAVEHEMDWLADYTVDDNGAVHLTCPNCGAQDTAEALPKPEP